MVIAFEREVEMVVEVRRRGDRKGVGDWEWGGFAGADGLDGDRVEAWEDRADRVARRCGGRARCCVGWRDWWGAGYGVLWAVGVAGLVDGRGARRLSDG